MAFRNKKHLPCTPKPGMVYETVRVVHKGISCDVVEFQKKPARNKGIPSPDDYRLSMLLAAGVKLNEASPIIDESITESDVEFINSLKPKEDETV